MAFEPRIVAAVFAGLGLLLLVQGIRVLRRRPLVAATGTLAAIVCLAAAAFCAALAASIHGYQALTREEVAAVVEIEPIVKQRFVAHVTLPDGETKTFRLSGDQLYVDARVLKWHPLANLLGLHTHYALDRIGGRYGDIDAEQSEPRTIYSLVDGARRLDAFVLRREHELLAPLVDASYGSATFTEADRITTLEVRVSTSGLLVRERAARAARR
jgi:hypothetical protein